MKKSTILLGLVTLLFGLLACKGPNTDDPLDNPFDNPDLQPPDEVTEVVDLSPTSIDGLHHFIFKPTCSNSGCHDGTFLPDFRTIESSYNTLLWKTPINLDSSGPYNYRVEPGNADFSMLYHRMTVEFGNNSGIMPLAVDPDSDWPEKKNEYLENIRTWINNGAPDMFGNLPQEGNLQPQLAGVVAFASGSTTPLDRKPGKGSIKVPQGTSSVDIWFALTDEETNPQDFTHNKVKFGDNLNDFVDYPEEDATIVSPIMEDDYFGDPANYYHKITYNTSALPEGKVVFFRIYVNDGGVLNTELPNDGGATYIKLYASLEIVP